MLLGRIDANNPLGLLLLPPSLFKLLESTVNEQTLDHNEQQLITHWDVHKTLKELPVMLSRKWLGSADSEVIFQEGNFLRI